MNNPLSLLDPSGFVPVCAIGAECPALKGKDIETLPEDTGLAFAFDSDGNLVAILANPNSFGGGLPANIGNNAAATLFSAVSAGTMDPGRITAISAVIRSAPGRNELITTIRRPSQRGNPSSLRPGSSSASNQGWGMFRPEGHPFVVGRAGNPLVSPGTGIGKFIDDSIPAGHTFGTNHDTFVTFLTGNGLPESVVNIPSMPPVYIFSLGQEVVNVATYLGNNVNVIGPPVFPIPFQHSHPTLSGGE